nr:hypothetical protein [Tanacetum cinerariifolium]
MSSFNQRECLGCGQPCDGLYCYPCTCQQCGVSLANKICLNCTYRDGKPLTCCECEGLLRGGFCWFCDSRAETSFAYDPNPNSVNDSQNLSDYPPQPQYETYPCELCGNDSHYGYDCLPWFPLVYEQEPSYNQNDNDNYCPHNSPSFLCCDNCGGPHESFQCQPMNQNYFEPNPCYDSYSFGFDQPPQYTIDHQEDLNQQSTNDESTIPLNEINSQEPSSIVITTSPPVLPIKNPEDSLIMGNEELNTISKKESDEFIKSSVEDLVPIPSESEDTSESDSVCILPSCDDFSPIDIPKEKAMTFSNPLFNSNDDFISSDDESLSDEDVPKDNNIESKDCYDPNLDEPDLLVTALSDANKDECFDSGGDVDKINDFEDGYYDSEGDILYLKSLLNDNLVLQDRSIPKMSVASILEGTIPEKESNEFIKSSVEDLDPIISESEDTSESDGECDLSSCENNFMSGNPTPSSNSKETFSFDIEEKNSGSTTTHSYYSLSNYEIFYFNDDHIEEKSSGSTTTHFDFFLLEYDLFIFDLSIDMFPPADRSVYHHEKFTDELTHIISSSEYDCFYFNTETDSGELTILFKENISKDSTKEFTSPELNDFPLLLSECDSTFSEEFYEIDLLVSFPSRNKDKVFDPGIFIIKRVQSKRFHIFLLDDFPTFSFVSDSLLLIDPSEIKIRK